MKLRPPGADDAAQMAELMSVGWPEPSSEASVLRALTAPSTDADRNARLAIDGSGTLVGTVILHEIGEGRGKFWLDLRTTSAADAETLLDWGEGRCRERSGGPARLFAGGWSADEVVIPALERHGFRSARYSLRMTIDLDAKTMRPVWPEGIVVRTLAAGDERRVYETHMETFADSWEHERADYADWSHWHLDATRYPPSLSFLAFDGEELAAIALCREDDALAGAGWVSILGVRRPWRKQGLGAALLRHAFAELAARGCSRAVLGVDGTSVTGAERLYERVGMTVADRFEIYEKAL